MASTETVQPPVLQRNKAGGSFLIENTAPDEVFTFEDLTEDHLAIGRAAEDFWKKEIQPQAEAIQHVNKIFRREVARSPRRVGTAAQAASGRIDNRHA